jgi:hypothetical protein
MKMTAVTTDKDRQLMERTLVVQDIRDNSIKFVIFDHFSQFCPIKPNRHISEQPSKAVKKNLHSTLLNEPDKCTTLL